MRIRYLNIIIRPAGGLCNLSCSYCNIRKNMSYRKPLVQISLEKIKEGIFSLIEQVVKFKTIEKITFTFHGGEPLILPLKFYEDIFSFQKRINRKPIQFENIFQTNGLALNEEKIEFLTSHNSFIGISIDGPTFFNNIFRFNNRYDKFKRVCRNIYLLKLLNIPFSLSIVIHEKNWKDHNKIFNFLADLNPQNGVSFIPRFDNPQSYISPDKYLLFLINFFEKWYSKDSPSFKVNIFNCILSVLQGIPVPFCYLTSGCGKFINVDEKGNIYSTCEPNKEYLLGNIFEKSLLEILDTHLENSQNLTKNLKNYRILEYLGMDLRYKYFISKGCPNRKINERDPYTFIFAKLIKFISFKVGKKNE